MSIFTCCEREDGTKYIHPCGCPSASFTCESVSINPRLCGFEEYTGDGITASVPPLKYLREISEWEQFDFDQWTCCTSGADAGHHKVRSTTLSDPARYEYLYNPSLDCNNYNTILDPSSNGCFSGARYGKSSQITQFCNSSPTTSSSCIPNLPSNSLVVSTVRKIREQHNETRFSGGTCNGDLSSKADEVYSFILSSPDTDANAISRETPTSGTLCSSLWSTRSTGFSWIKRTSSYEIECASLVVGVEYEVAPLIRRRTAVIGSEGAWEDVTVTAATFTATSNTKTLAAVALGHIQGYEYQITGVTIEKT